MNTVLAPFSGVTLSLSLALACLLFSCAPATNPDDLRAQAAKVPPKTDITPPAKFTKGAPEYTMQFHTVAENNSVRRRVRARMISHPGPEGGASPQAYHMIPAGMNMGDHLPLLPPEHGSRPEEAQQERMAVKHYWGCDDGIRKGQPRIHDSGKTGAGDASDGEYSGHGDASPGGLKPGWAETLRPNRDDQREAPNNASLVGDHFVHGNFLPHIRFSMDSRHELMDALSVRAESGSPQDAIAVSWNKPPTAIGYHVSAMSFNAARQETIIWSSSEKAEPLHVGRFLPTPQVHRYISEKVILPADRNRCVIPRGIFAAGDKVTVTVTAWGEDYWASQPPRPADAPKNWKPDWVVKGQFLSTGQLVLGRNTGGGRPAPKGLR